MGAERPTAHVLFFARELKDLSQKIAAGEISAEEIQEKVQNLFSEEKTTFKDELSKSAKQGDLAGQLIYAAQIHYNDAVLEMVDAILQIAFPQPPSSPELY